MSKPNNKPGVPRKRVTHNQATAAIISQLEKTIETLQSDLCVKSEKMAILQGVNEGLKKFIEASNTPPEREQILEALGFERGELGWTSSHCTLAFDVALDEIVWEVSMNANSKMLDALVSDLNATKSHAILEFIAIKAKRREACVECEDECRA
ncbi:MAG: hypothetical protein WCK90_00545 [archaeon]